MSTHIGMKFISNNADAESCQYKRKYSKRVRYSGVQEGWICPQYFLNQKCLGNILICYVSNHENVICMKNIAASLFSVYKLLN